MAGADGFGPEWYKVMQDLLVPTLLKTFNWVMANKIVPPSWREAIITPVQKRYRGIGDACWRCGGDGANIF